MAPTTENLDDILRNLLALIPGVKATAIVSSEGIPIASVIPQSVDKERITPMTAPLHSLAKRLVTEMGIGKFDNLYIKGKQGFILILKADPKLRLIVSMTSNVRLGLLHLDCKGLCEKIRKLFESESENDIDLHKYPSIKCPVCSYNMVFPFRDLCPNCSTDLKDIIKQKQKRKERKWQIKTKHRKQKSTEEEEEFFMVFEDDDYYELNSPFPSIPVSSIRKFLSSIPGGKGVSIVSLDGLPIASALPQNTNDWRIAPMTAALFALAEKSVIEMQRSELDYIYVEGSNGYLLIQKVDPNALLIISLKKNARSGLILFDLIRMRDRKDFLKRLSGYDKDGDLPFPYIFKPPTPPGDLAIGGQVQIKRPKNGKELQYEPYCKHCGSILPEGQSICHVCGKRVI